MKNNITFLFIVSIFSCAFAQNEKGLRFGVRAGVNSSILTDIETGRRASFYTGIYMPLRVAKWYEFQPELNYSRQGSKVDYYNPIQPTSSNRDRTMKFDYLGLSLNNKFYVVDNLHLMLAPFVDLAVHHNYEYFGPDEDLDAGAIAGIGYEFQNGFGIEARAKIGYVETVSDEYSGVDKIGIYNQVFQVGLTYTFQLNASNKS